MPSVSDLEKQIFEKEGVRVIIRAPSSQDVPAYDFSRKLPDSSNISDLRNRINKTNILTYITTNDVLILHHKKA